MTVIFNHTVDDPYENHTGSSYINEVELKRLYDVLVYRQKKWPNIYPQFDLTLEEWNETYITIYYRHFPDFTITDYDPNKKRRTTKQKVDSINLKQLKKQNAAFYVPRVQRPKRPVVVFGTRYDSAGDAGKALDIEPGTVRARCDRTTNKWKDYMFADQL